MRCAPRHRAADTARGGLRAGCPNFRGPFGRKAILQRSDVKSMPPAAAPTPQPPGKSGRREGAEPLRRRRATPPAPAPSAWKRRSLNIVLVFVTVVLVVEALVGDRGLIEMIRARRQWRAAAADLTRVSQENEALREEARSLKDDLY